MLFPILTFKYIIYIINQKNKNKKYFFDYIKNVALRIVAHSVGFG